jgi:hypothetical protein
MDANAANENALKKFQVTIDDRIAYVETISLTEQIYSVEFPGSAPVFITRIRDKSKQICWISIPQGNNDLAAIVGVAIDQRMRPHGMRDERNLT